MSEAEIVSALLALSPKKRAEIAGILLRSLEDEDTDEGIDAAWVKEIERRVEELRRGDVATSPGVQVMKRLRLKVRRAKPPRR